MANCCFCDFTIEFDTEAEKESFINDFQEEISKANKEFVGVFFGCDKRYLFDAEVFDGTTTSVHISCWVKWCITDEDMMAFIEYIKNNHNKNYNVKSISVSYEELASDLIGRYKYDGEKLIENFLSQEQFDKIYNESKGFEDDDDAYEEYRNKLYDKLNTAPSVKIVPLG